MYNILYNIWIGHLLVRPMSKRVQYGIFLQRINNKALVFVRTRVLHGDRCPSEGRRHIAENETGRFEFGLILRDQPQLTSHYSAMLREDGGTQPTNIAQIILYLEVNFKSKH